MTVNRTLNQGAMVGLTTMASSWLIANKQYPWLPAWNEGLAFAAILILWAAAAMRSKKHPRKNPGVTWPLLAFVLVALLVVWGQYFAGLLIFSGDAWLISLYLCTFFIAIHTGALIATKDEREDWMTAFMGVIVISAVFSVGIALIQWTKTWDSAVFLMETELGDRPGANLGQTNNLNSLFFMAVCGVLYLHSRERLHIGATLLVGGFLGFGMAITQSRTGWLQMASVLLLLLFSKQNKNQKIVCVLLSAAFITFYIGVPRLQNVALLTAEQQTRALPLQDVRLIMWSALLEASSMRPWFGYGWLQTGWAQQVTAVTHPILRTYMSYSHNLALDLIVWNGWPIAMALLGFVLVWFLQYIKNLRKIGGDVYLYCAVLGLLIHGMLEYPLVYAYFLMPVGLIMGYLDGAHSSLVKFGLNLKAVALVVIVAGILFVTACVDYVNAVQLDAMVRFQSLKIGHHPEGDQPPNKFLIFNQLAAMYAMRVIPEEGYSDEKNMALMAKVVQRYPYSPALFQYALANAMGGKSAEAEKQLKVLCGIYEKAHCRTLAKRWKRFQQIYPESVGLVKFP